MNKLTIFSAYNQTKKLLMAAGIEDYALEARYIIRHITGYDNAKILTNYTDELTPLQQTVLNNIINRRCSHYPLQYILGVWQFYGLNFYVGEGVLIPRADTETLIDVSLDFLKEKPTASVLDLCSGSGCIAITLAKNSDCTVTAVEKYETAFGFLEKNIKKHSANVIPVLADIFEYKADKKYDLIVSNPPYISGDELDDMNKETSFEPKEALFAQEDGLVFYKHIIKNYKDCLNSGGMLALEIGFRQAAEVKKLFQKNGYLGIAVKEDYSGNQRVVFGTVN